MSWFDKVKSLWSSNEAVEELEPTPNIGDAFVNVCNANGLGEKVLDQTNAIELFEQWYEGDGSEEDVLNSILPFMSQHPGVNAKLTRFFKR